MFQTRLLFVFVKKLKFSKKYFFFSSQSIPNGVLNIETSQSRLSDLGDRGGSCPPSAVTTPATTPIGAQGCHICDYTVTITSDEFIYAKITRTDYRNMRNQMEIRNAQKVSSMERLNKTSEMSIAIERNGLTMDSGFETNKSGHTNKSDVTVSSDAICQSEFTEGPEVDDSFFTSRRRRNTIHASLIDLSSIIKSR